MPLKKQRHPGRWETKDARELAAVIRRAGGSTERTARGHMKITGPAGWVVVTPDAGNYRTRRNTLAQIRRETGLVLG